MNGQIITVVGVSDSFSLALNLAEARANKRIVELRKVGIKTRLASHNVVYVHGTWNVSILMETREIGAELR